MQGSGSRCGFGSTEARSTHTHTSTSASTLPTLPPPLPHPHIFSSPQVLLTSHLGRPKDGPEDKFSLNPVRPRLEELLGSTVKKVDDCIGSAVEEALKTAKKGEVGAGWLA